MNNVVLKATVNAR